MLPVSPLLKANCSPPISIPVTIPRVALGPKASPINKKGRYS